MFSFRFYFYFKIYNLKMNVDYSLMKYYFYLKHFFIETKFTIFEKKKLDPFLSEKHILDSN